MDDSRSEFCLCLWLYLRWNSWIRSSDSSQQASKDSYGLLSQSFRGKTCHENMALGELLFPVFFFHSQNHLLCSHMSTLQKHHKSISLSKFSSLPNPTAYVPEVKTPFDPFPILLCDVRSMNLELIEWEDPEDLSYRSHTVTTDIPGIENRKIFR